MREYSRQLSENIFDIVTRLIRSYRKLELKSFSDALRAEATYCERLACKENDQAFSNQWRKKYYGLVGLGASLGDSSMQIDYATILANQGNYQESNQWIQIVTNKTTGEKPAEKDLKGCEKLKETNDQQLKHANSDTYLEDYVKNLLISLETSENNIFTKETKGCSYDGIEQLRTVCTGFFNQRRYQQEKNKAFILSIDMKIPGRNNLCGCGSTISVTTDYLKVIKDKNLEGILFSWVGNGSYVYDDYSIRAIFQESLACLEKFDKACYLACRLSIVAYSADEPILIKQINKALKNIIESKDQALTDDVKKKIITAVFCPLNLPENLKLAENYLKNNQPLEILNKLTSNSSTSSFSSSSSSSSLFSNSVSSSSSNASASSSSTVELINFSSSSSSSPSSSNS